MAAIAAANVTITPIGKGTKEYSKSQVVSITFGNGTLTYPTSGVPVTGIKSAGFPNTIGSVTIYAASPGDGFLYKYDPTNSTIRIYQAPASGPAALVELTTAATPAATTLLATVSGF